MTKPVKKNCQGNLAKGIKPQAGGVQICNLIILPAAGEKAVFDATIVIENGKVTDFGRGIERSDLPCYDGDGYLVTPGFINAHTHAPMSFFRGLVYTESARQDDHSLIEDFFFPMEKSLTAELMTPLSYSYLVDGLRAGVTCFVDGYFDSLGVGQALERLGLRGVIGEHIADLGGPRDAGQALWHKVRERMAKWPFSSRVKPLVYAHAADTVSRPLLTELAKFAHREKLPFHMHLSQTHGERNRVVSREGVSPVEYARQCGVLSESSLVVHLVSADARDCKILKDEGVTIGLCPVSEILYEELPPLKLFMQHDIPIALGTDCAASNDGADLLREMHITALLMKQQGVEPTVSSEQLFAMATVNAAKVLKLGSLGTITKGGPADLVFFQPTIATEPMDRLLNNLVFSFKAQHVRHVMVDGTWVLWNQGLCLANEDDLKAEYLAAVAKVKKG